jgi:hypothetical protein
LSTIAGFYKYTVEEELLDRSPAAHVRRPRVDCESHAMERNELSALLVAAGLGPRTGYALISLLALNGLQWLVIRSLPVWMPRSFAWCAGGSLACGPADVLGHLYGPGDGKTFDGVIGKDLSNPIRDGPSSAPTARWCPHRRRGLPQPRLEVSGPGGCFQQAHKGHLPGRLFSGN